MYPVSSAFHEAVANGNRQKAMLIFPDAVFTDEDINIDRGITFHDRFNMKDSISIGQTPSNEISFSLFNDYKYLNNYEFGDFLATVGVYVGEEEYEIAGNAYLRTNYATYIGLNGNPYLRRNGAAMAVPPTFGVVSLLAYDGKVWAFSNNGDYAVYDDRTGANITDQNPVNAFMRAKSKNWEGKGYFYNKDSRVLFIYNNVTGIRQRYEFCPFGWFTAERPNAPDQIVIDMQCYDLMQKFDKDMPTKSELGISYPVTIGTLFTKLCDYVGLPYRTNLFINSTATVSESQVKDDFKNSTMRTVLGWIAEVAGSNARIDRDGYVVLDWVRTTTQAFDENGYRAYEPYWYESKPVSKLYVRDSTDYDEKTYGTGEEAYLIQDNPLL